MPAGPAICPFVAARLFGPLFGFENLPRNPAQDIDFLHFKLRACKPSSMPASSTSSRRAPYSQIEITPSYGTVNSSGEDFTLGDVDILANWAKANGLGGLHFWALYYDTNLTYTNEFVKDLGL